MKYEGIERNKNVQEMTYCKEKGLRVLGDRQADF
jgi:hypothetical protein